MIYHHNMRGCFDYQKVHVYVLCALTQYLYFLRLYYVLKVSGVDGEVSPPVLLVLNLTQLKRCGIRLW